MDITILQLLRSLTTFPQTFDPSVAGAKVYFNQDTWKFYKSVEDIPFSCVGVYEVDISSFDQSFAPFKGTECFAMRIMSSGNVTCEINIFNRKPTSVFSVYAKVAKVEPKQVSLDIPAGVRVSMQYISQIGTVIPATGAVKLASPFGTAEVMFFTPMGSPPPPIDVSWSALTVVQANACIICIPPDIPPSTASEVVVLGTVYVRDTSKLTADIESAIIGSTTLVLSPSSKSTGGYLYVGLHDGTPLMGKNVKARIEQVNTPVPADKFGGFINLYFDGGVYDFGNRTHKTIEGAKGKADADRSVHQFAVIIGE